MKRYEVRRQLMDGDFPWQHQYTDICRVSPPSGSTPIWGCMGALPNEPIQPLRFSASMIAHVLADEVQGAHVPLVSVPQK